MNHLIEVASAIQLAVAPAFLLTGIGAILGVMTNRLARIIDRFRILNQKQEQYELNKNDFNEIILLKSRANWTHWAIASTTLSALLVCVVIGLIFIATEVRFDFDKIIAMLFVSATTLLVLGLLLFIKEVALSKNVLK